CHRLHKRGLLDRGGEGYAIADRDLALRCLQAGTVRTDYVDAMRDAVPIIQPGADLLDLLSAVVEHGTIRLRIGVEQCQHVRTFLMNEGRLPAPYDRSAKLSYSGNSFTLVVASKGALAL